jgi:hypothetical protein
MVPWRLLQGAGQVLEGAGAVVASATFLDPGPGGAFDDDMVRPCLRTAHSKLAQRPPRVAVSGSLMTRYYLVTSGRPPIRFAFAVQTVPH